MRFGPVGRAGGKDADFVDGNRGSEVDLHPLDVLRRHHDRAVVAVRFTAFGGGGMAEAALAVDEVLGRPQGDALDGVHGGHLLAGGDVSSA